MKQSPIVSVIMPTYNSEKTLRKAVNSILSQSIKNWELIIIDDCSTDGTYQLAISLSEADPRIQVLQLDSNSGAPLVPRKEGFKLASGEWIVAIDSDDWVEENFIEKLLIRQAETNSDLILCKNISGTTGKTLVPTYHLDTSLIYSGEECLIHTLFAWHIGGVALGSRDKYISAYDSDIDISMQYADENLFRILLMKSKSVAISDAKYYYFENPESITRCGSFRRLDHLEMTQWIKDVVYNEFQKGSLVRRAAKKHVENEIVTSLHYLLNKEFSEEQRKIGINRINKVSKLQSLFTDQTLPKRHRLLLFLIKTFGAKPTFTLLKCMRIGRILK